MTVRVMETKDTSLATGKLTRAERRVLALVSAAKTNKEIAFALGISPGTVKRHLENVLGKLALKNRVEAAIYGLIANGCPNGSNSRLPSNAVAKPNHDAETKCAVWHIDGLNCAVL